MHILLPMSMLPCHRRSPISPISPISNIIVGSNARYLSRLADSNPGIGKLTYQISRGSNSACHIHSPPPLVSGWYNLSVLALGFSNWSKVLPPPIGSCFSCHSKRGPGQCVGETLLPFQQSLFNGSSMDQSWIAMPHPGLRSY